MQATDLMQPGFTGSCNARFDSGARLNLWSSPLITGLLLSGLTVGTGGAITTTALAGSTSQLRTSGAFEYTRQTVRRETDDESVMSTSQQLTLIQHLLGLNTTEVAQVIGVTRPTIYSWTRGHQEPHSSNYERISMLYQFARSWQRIHPKSLGSLVRQPILGSQSLVQMLSAKEFDALQIDEALQALGQLALSRHSATVKPVLFDLPEESQRTRLSEEFGM